MDNLIEEMVKEFKKKEKKIDKRVEKLNKSSKIVVKINEAGVVQILGVDGTETALLSAICLILQNMEENSNKTAEEMAMIVLTAITMEKKNQ